MLFFDVRKRKREAKKRRKAGQFDYTQIEKRNA
jgi:hypothetical protein